MCFISPWADDLKLNAGKLRLWYWSVGQVVKNSCWRLSFSSFLLTLCSLSCHIPPPIMYNSYYKQAPFEDSTHRDLGTTSPRTIEVPLNVEWSNFWPRAMLKGPKRSFVVVFLRVGGESWAKNVPNRTKIVRGNKKCVREQKMYRVSQKDRYGENALYFQHQRACKQNNLWQSFLDKLISK